MRRTSMWLAMLASGVLAYVPVGALAQNAVVGPASSAQALGTVKEGNTTIEFQSASANPAGMEPIKVWSEFAAQHPYVARDLGNKPSRIKDAAYLKKHPELASFFEQHPDVRDAMADNPGNFVAPSSASAH
jgi:hypothetical protein